ncbi:MAG TPA: hypothetical protein VMH61_05255 [Candidatus Acidoferrales bacterium]|nr:hypothetical protein [Candidatus Acidoferrales bacterium]
MSPYSLAHLADHVLLRDLGALVALDRATTADLLAHLAEVDARKLYLPAGYPSMYAWCVGELHVSEQTAFKRIRAARTARQFPAALDAVADSRLNVSGIVLLAPHLTRDNARELLDAAAGRRREEIDRLIAERFPQSDVASIMTPLRSPLLDEPLLNMVHQHESKLSPGTVEGGDAEPDPNRVEMSLTRAKVMPLSPQRYALQVTLAQATHDKLRARRNCSAMHCARTLHSGPKPGLTLATRTRSCDTLASPPARLAEAARPPALPGFGLADSSHLACAPPGAARLRIDGASSTASRAPTASPARCGRTREALGHSRSPGKQMAPGLSHPGAILVVPAGCRPASLVMTRCVS